MGTATCTADTLLPAAMGEYHAATEAKHFGPGAVGSRFTSAVPNLRELLRFAQEQRGSLDGDDRALLTAHGADAGAFAPSETGIRYLAVNVSGTVRIVRTDQLEGATPVKAVATKPDTPCSLVVVADVAEQRTDIATIVVGPNPDSGDIVLFTAHPGLPVRPATHEKFVDGQELTVDEVVTALGHVWLQLP